MCPILQSLFFPRFWTGVNGAFGKKKKKKNNSSAGRVQWFRSYMTFTFADHHFTLFCITHATFRRREVTKQKEEGKKKTKKKEKKIISNRVRDSRGEMGGRESYVRQECLTWPAVCSLPCYLVYIYTLLLLRSKRCADDEQLFQGHRCWRGHPPQKKERNEKSPLSFISFFIAKLYTSPQKSSHENYLFQTVRSSSFLSRRVLCSNYQKGEKWSAWFHGGLVGVPSKG